MIIIAPASLAFLSSVCFLFSPFCGQYTPSLSLIHPWSSPYFALSIIANALMERRPYKPFPIPKAGAAVVDCYELTGHEDDNSLLPRHSLSHGSENPKTVLKKRLSFRKLSVHFFAIATTIAAVGVNFGNIFSWDEGSLYVGDNQVYNLLQFAAKLHELLIIGSVTSMIMHWIRRRLHGNKGLPFGLLSTGYQISSIEFLCSKGLWSAVSTDCLLVWTVAATIVFVTVVGPSSAIVVRPRLDWWNARPVFNRPIYNDPPRLYINASLDQLYPITLGRPNMTLYPGCDTLEYTSGCPGAAFSDLKNWAASWYNNGVAPNISITEVTTNAQRALLTRTVEVNPNNVSVATTLTQPILEMNGLFWDYVQDNKLGEINNVKRPKFVSTDSAPVYAPVVRVECAWFNYSEAIKSPGPNVSFPMDVLDNRSGISGPWPVHPSYWNFTRPKDITNFTWIDVSAYSDGNGRGASLGALITLPTLAMDDAYKSKNTGGVSQQSWLVPCLINAKWAAAKTQHEPRTGNQILHNITDPSAFGVGHANDVTYGLSDAIRIAPEWAALLNVAGIASTLATGENINATMVEALLNQFVIMDQNLIYSPYMAKGANFTAFAPPETYNVVPATIAAVVAEGLSRQAYGWTAPFILTEVGPNNTTLARLTQQKGWDRSGLIVTNMSVAEFDEVVNGSFTSVDLTVMRFGYGYGYKKSATVEFGIAILLIHAFAVMAYFIHTLHCRFSPTGFSSSAWGAMGEMLALALHSARATELQNVGGGVKATSTWQMKVRVRERGGGDRLELVVGDEDFEHARPRLDKKYR